MSDETFSTWANGAEQLKARRRKVWTAAELLAADLPPESPEEAYRRGYRDGWVQAINALHDLMFQAGHSRQRAYARAWDHWQGPLLEWQHGNCARLVRPPQIEEEV